MLEQIAQNVHSDGYPVYDGSKLAEEDWDKISRFAWVRNLVGIDCQKSYALYEHLFGAEAANRRYTDAMFAVEAEREACAKIAEGARFQDVEAIPLPDQISAAIRARGSKE